MGLATAIRFELAYPGLGIFAGDSLQYLSVVTAHGVIMVFFMIMPLLFGAFGNFLLPTQLGVHDVAFPRLNSAAFWFLPAGFLMLGQLLCIDRRYQRMNCFNIREAQSILKREFFTDLVHSNDHRDLLNSTMLNYRYKTGSDSSLNPNFLNFITYGTSINELQNESNYLNSVNITNHIYSEPDLIQNYPYLENLNLSIFDWVGLYSLYDTYKHFFINSLNFHKLSLNTTYKFDKQLTIKDLLSNTKLGVLTTNNIFLFFQDITDFYYISLRNMFTDFFINPLTFFNYSINNTYSYKNINFLNEKSSSLITNSGGELVNEIRNTQLFEPL